MELNIHKDVQELLNELNEIGNAYIFGGYLRDILLGGIPNDVDIVTDIPLEIIENIFSTEEKSTRRQTVSGHDMYSFKLHRSEKIFVEIVYSSDSLLGKSKDADYTLNSLLYDGTSITDSQNGIKDMKEGVILPVNINIIRRDLQERPFLWLKTLRLTSVFGFKLSDSVFNTLNEQKNVIKSINPNIMQTEGHKILNGAFPTLALQYLMDMGLISEYKIIHRTNWNELKLSLPQKLCILALSTNKHSVDDYLALFQFPQATRDKYEELLFAYKNENSAPNRLRHLAHTIRKVMRTQLQN